MRVTETVFTSCKYLTIISRGDFDSDIRRLARELRDFGYPVLFRPMREMNDDWTTWSGNANGNTPADFIRAWRHMYEIFLEEGVSNGRHGGTNQ